MAEANSEIILEVAGIRLRLRAEAGLALESPRHAYCPFLAPEHCSVGDDGISLEVCARPPPDPRGARPVFDTGDGWRLLGTGEGLLLCSGAPSASRWVASLDRDWRKGTVHVAEILVQRGPEGARVRHLLQYPLDQILYIHRLAHLGGLLVHAAGALLDGAALLFPGISGAGKSTVSRLLRERGDWRFASDDRMALRRTPAGVRAFGTPWPGDARIAEATGAPLGALCFLTQAPDTKLRDLTPAEALGRLMPVASIPWYDRALVERALDTCEALVRDHPCHELRFRPRSDEIHAELDTLRIAA